jgi:hypothetical protein
VTCERFEERAALFVMNNNRGGTRIVRDMFQKSEGRDNEEKMRRRRTDDKHVFTVSSMDIGRHRHISLSSGSIDRPLPVAYSVAAPSLGAANQSAL